MLQHTDFKKYTEYLAECRKYKFPSVSLIDKKNLIAYLTGEIDTCENISSVPSLPTEFEPQIASSKEDDIERAPKKTKNRYSRYKFE